MADNKSKLTGWIRRLMSAAGEGVSSSEARDLLEEAHSDLAKSGILEAALADILLPGAPLNNALVDSVLLIDGDNDPHLPPDFTISERALVRVFLRTDAKMPRGLEKRLTGLPFCAVVRSPRGGANAADFIMSLHVGMLHATLPMSIPFKMVTNDTALSVMVLELQRIGRQAELWTSHQGRVAPKQDAGGPAAGSSRSRSSSSGGGGGRGRGRGRGRSRTSSSSSSSSASSSSSVGPVVPSTLEPAPALSEPVEAAEPTAVAGSSGKTLTQVASAYALRLGRIKDPPSRLKTLLNDIKNRASASGYSPEAILEELKSSHGVSVDDNGKVHVAKKG